MTISLVTKFLVPFVNSLSANVVSNVLDWLYYFIGEKYSSIVYEHLVLGDNEIF